MTVISTMLNVLQLSELTYSRRAGIWADRSIDIVSPRVSAEERLSLRAELRSVESARQYYALYERLNKIAKQNEIILPTFAPIGLPAKT